jgi:hypothetical protein
VEVGWWVGVGGGGDDGGVVGGGGGGGCVVVVVACGPAADAAAVGRLLAGLLLCCFLAVLLPLLPLRRLRSLLFWSALFFLPGFASCRCSLLVLLLCGDCGRFCLLVCLFPSVCLCL